MALIKCPECGRDVSDTCDACIHCGYRLRRSNIYRENKSDEPDGISETIAERGEAGGMVAVCVINTVFGIICLVMFSIWISNGIENALWWAQAIVFSVLALGLFYVAIGIYGFVKISRAGRLVDPCVVFYKSAGIVEMTTLGGRKIRIPPTQIVSAKAGFSTDFMFVVYYLDKSHVRQKANLGFALNRPAAVAGVIGLKNRISSDLVKKEEDDR